MGIENDTQYNEAYRTTNKYAIPALTGTKNRTQHTGGVTHTTRAPLSLTGIENDTQHNEGKFPSTQQSPSALMGIENDTQHIRIAHPRYCEKPQPSWVSKTIPSTTEAYRTTHKYASPALTGTKNRTQHTGEGNTHHKSTSLPHGYRKRYPARIGFLHISPIAELKIYELCGVVNNMIQ